jgi:predicted PurR-regulated permease PerM
MNYIDNDRLKQIFFLLIIILWGVLLFSELYGLFPGLLGALTLYVLCRRWMLHLVEKRGWRKSVAAATLMFLSFIIILLPFGLLINMLTAKAGYVISHSSELVQGIKSVDNRLHEATGYSVLTPGRMQKVQETIADLFPILLGATFNTVTAIAIMYFVLYFMLVYAREMEATLYEYIPLKDENVIRIGHELHTMIFSNAVGIPLIAIVQGVVALVAYLIFRVPQPVFWFAVTCFTSMLPIIGAAAVYVPMGVYLIAAGHTWQGIAILVYGFVVVGASDNVFRMMLVKKIGDVHPLITVFGVIVGVSLFGFIGLIFGPLLISMFILLLKIYSNEYLVKKREVKVIKTGGVTVREKK